MPEARLSHLPCDLLVFDLDGTLIDSQLDLANSVNASLVAYGRAPLDQTVISDFIGDGASALLQRALNATGGCDESTLSGALAYFLNYYRSHSLDHTTCYAGVVSALLQIREQFPALPLAILTNKPVGASRVICDGLELSRFFFEICGGNSFATKKPHPEGLFTIVQRASAVSSRTLDVSRTVLIGDSHVDVETARNAGARSIGCLYGLSPDTLRAASPDALVSSASEWVNAIRGVISER